MVLYEEKGSIFNTTDTERTVLLFLLLQNIDLILIKCWWMWEAWRSLFYLFIFLTWRIFFNCVCDLGYALLLLEILLGLCLFQLCLWHRICLLSSEVIKIIHKNKIFRILHSKFTHDTFCKFGGPWEYYRGLEEQFSILFFSVIVLCLS
jgi:hypothetical protein